MRPAATALIIFLTILLLTTLMAYSVNIPIASVDPLPAKREMTYVLGKNNTPSDRNEVRSVSLSLSGTAVTGAAVTFHKRTPGTYPILTTVSLLDAGGSTISTGTACTSYTGTGSRTATVTFSPAVSVDAVYTVWATIARVASC